MAYVVTRHRKSCRTVLGRRCNCTPSYQARFKPDGRNGKVTVRSFPTKAMAAAWAAEVETEKRKGVITCGSTVTIKEAGDRLVQEMEEGLVRAKGGDTYRLRVIQNYAAALESVIYPPLGQMRLGDVRRHHVQDIASGLLASGSSPSTVRNKVMPLRVIFREALRRGDILVSPCDHLNLPACRGRRERVATPTEARQLLEALRPDDQALWASAFYAGLRRGEIAALRWEDVDLDSYLLHVRRSFDANNGRMTLPKTTSGSRRLPLIPQMRSMLLVHQLATGRRDGLVFGVTPTNPFTPTAVRTRALKAWERAELAPIGLHECRHTYASLLIAAGVNRKELATYMGHAQVSTSEDLYGHLFPGHEAATAQRLQTYLDAVS